MARKVPTGTTNVSTDHHVNQDSQQWRGNAMEEMCFNSTIILKPGLTRWSFLNIYPTLCLSTGKRRRHPPTTFCRARWQSASFAHNSMFQCCCLGLDTHFKKSLRPAVFLTAATIDTILCEKNNNKNEWAVLESTAPYHCLNPILIPLAVHQTHIARVPLRYRFSPYHTDTSASSHQLVFLFYYRQSRENNFLQVCSWQEALCNNSVISMESCMC